MAAQNKNIDSLAASKGINADEYRKTLHAEYEEIGRCWRHYDQLAGRVYSIVIPTSLAAFYVSLINRALWIPIGGSVIILIWIAFLFYGRQYRGNSIRWNRAQEIEGLLGMEHHLRTRKHIEHKSSVWDRLPTIRVLLLLSSLLVTAFWVLLRFAPGVMGVTTDSARRPLSEYRFEGQIQHTQEQGMAIDSVSGTILEVQIEPDSAAGK